MNLLVDVFYSNNKAGTYVQFELPVNCRELSELNSYDKILQKQISKDFSDLFKQFSMDFSTESSYLVNDKENFKLILEINQLIGLHMSIIEHIKREDVSLLFLLKLTKLKKCGNIIIERAHR